MQDRPRFAGFAVQPMLAVFSLCLFSIAVGLDLLGLATAQPFWAELSSWDIAGGLFGGLLTGAAFAHDLLEIPSGTSAARLGLAHALLHGGALGLFGLSLALRVLDRPLSPSPLAVGLAALGLVLLVITRWLGGLLRERLVIAARDPGGLDERTFPDG